MRLEDTTRQKSGQLELPFGSKGETPRAGRSGEVLTASNGTERSGTATKLLMEQVVELSNVVVALKKVQRNKGSPGIDGMTVQELKAYLVENWQSLRASLLAGTYQPKPVRRQEIPKSGGGVRQLGISCALDRFVQQCILQVLQPRFDLPSPSTATGSDLDAEHTMQCARRRSTSSTGTSGWQTLTWPYFSTGSITTCS